ncbi:YbhB/YbcL family Raf kinase inhibitor-like protein [Dermatophilaceae bacterium Soc4.6]
MPHSSQAARLVPVVVGLFLLLSACSATPDLSSVPGSGSTTGRSGFALAPATGFASSTAFARESTCEGSGDLSPGLDFVGVPADTAALALTMVDTDAPGGRVHWIQLLPGDAVGIKQHVLAPGARELTNDFGEATYDGPCPPAGPPHHYVLSLVALATPFTATAGADPRAVVAAIRSAATATASLTVTYAKG